MNFLKPAKFFVTLSTLLVLTSFALLLYPGPKLSIEFTGGTLMELSAKNTSTDNIKSALEAITLPAPIGQMTINSTTDGTYIVRLRTLSNQEHTMITDTLSKKLEEYNEQQFTTIGSVVGSTMKSRSITALILASIAIILYVAFAFRTVPKELSSWRFGVIAVVALVHDVSITTGLFVILSHYTAFEFDTLFITALLTILGYSVNDTIIIFDRIRDNLQKQEKKEDFATLANRSLNESMRRSVSTSGATLIVLVCLYLFGAESIKWFILALVFGIGIGTYSSIFLAVPLLVYWRTIKKR